MNNLYYVFDYSSQQFIALICREDLEKLISQYKVIRSNKGYYCLYKEDKLVYSIWKKTNRHPFAYYVEHGNRYPEYGDKYTGYWLRSKYERIIEEFVYNTDLTNLIDYSFMLNSEIINRYPLPAVSKPSDFVKLMEN